MAKIPPPTADTVYQIITGFYPEITSNPSASRGEGNAGSTGAKYKLVKGWTESSIERTKFDEGKQEAGKKAEYLKQQNPDFKGRKTVGIGHRKIMDKDNVFTGKYEPYYKWTGGSDKYRIFGDVVWYMHAKRNSAALEEYVKGFGRTAPQFSNIYAKSEGNLAQTAKAFANEIVNDVVDDVAKKEMKKRIDVWNADGQWKPSQEAKDTGGIMSPEEMGFTIGNVEYKSTPAGKKTHDGIGKIAKDSGAQVIDMVKIVDGKVVEVMDVTEQKITEVGQHGISEGLEGLTELEGVIEKFALDTTDPSAPAIVAIKEAVTKMFQKAIDNEYNPIISKLTSYAKKTGDSNKSRWEQVLAQVKKDVGKGKTKEKAFEPDITKAAGLEYAKLSTIKGGGDQVNQTSMRYITHMLGTMGGNAGATFSQSHRVADYPTEGDFSGQSLYAIVPMKMDEETLLFDRAAPAGTEVLAGYNATLAQAVAHHGLSEEAALEKSRGINHTWQTLRVTGHTTPRAGAVYTASQQGLQKHAYHSTSVSSIAGPALEKILRSIVSNLSTGQFTSAAKGVLKENPYYWNPGQGIKGGSGKRATRLRKGNAASGGGNPMFWALPYIGIQQSEHKKK